MDNKLFILNTLHRQITLLFYVLQVNGANWFTSEKSADGGYAYSADGSTFSHSNGALQALGQPSTGRGSDEAGAFKFITVSWGRKTSRPNPSSRTSSPAEFATCLVLIPLPRCTTIEFAEQKFT